MAGWAVGFYGPSAALAIVGSAVDLTAYLDPLGVACGLACLGVCGVPTAFLSFAAADAALARRDRFGRPGPAWAWVLGAAWGGGFLSIAGLVGLPTLLWVIAG